jgi:arylsulfatase A
METKANMNCIQATCAVLGWLLILFPTAWAANSAVAQEKPNLILIMADDLGYETIGANGGTSYRTPVLDKLAATGARFTQCYVQPLCTPTRVQLMTGQYNVRNYIRFGTLDPRAVTFGNLLKQAGYSTCIAGKWQLGRNVDLPQRFGFDESCLWQHTRRPPRYANPGLEINGAEKDYSAGEYGPDLVNDYAIDFVTRKQNEPFFLYYPMMLTHSPYQPTPDSKSWDPTLQGEKEKQNDKHFGEMVEYMDKLIGKLLGRVDSLGLREKTLIVFLGDNGTGKGIRSQMGDRVVIGGKGTTTEAGMHVPLIVNWAGTLMPKVSHELVDSTDFLPTLLDAAGVKPPTDLTLDGYSILPQLRQNQPSPREWIYSWYSPRQGNEKKVREFAFDQHFKLYRTGEFFDLIKDSGEKQPLQIDSLSGEPAAAAKRLQKVLDRYNAARPSELDDLPATEEESPAKPQKKDGRGNKQNKVAASSEHES